MRLVTGEISLQELYGVRTRLSWFLLVRTIVISVLLISLIGFRIGSGQSVFGLAAYILYGVCTLSYISILCGALWLRKYRSKGLLGLSYIQLFGDAMVAALLVISTGGFESAFIFLFSLTILSAAAVLNKRASFLLAIVSSILFLGILGAQLAGELTHIGLEKPAFLVTFPSILANILAFFLVAILSGSLTEQISQSRRSLSRARKSLIEFEKLHETVLENLPTGVITLNEDREILFINKSAEKILNISRTFPLEQELNKVLPELIQSKQDSNHFEFARETGTSTQFISGSIVSIDGLGFSSGNIVTLEDLTELRNLQEISTRSDRLQTIGRFAAGMAHELRNPLAGMLGSLQLLQKDISELGHLDENGPKLLSLTYEEATRLSRLVSEFLLFARPASPQLENADLVSIVSDTIISLNLSSSTMSSIQIVSDISSNAYCDRHQIRQVLLNLLHNALDAVSELKSDRPTAGSEPDISVRVFETETHHHIRIDDAGPGVKLPERSQIFEPFFTSKPSGIGLGLSVCHQIIEAHSGEIKLDSSPLGGARFEVKLPRASGG
jgi:two-component system, NtrC family, sensor histidine kinase PilS